MIDWSRWSQEVVLLMGAPVQAAQRACVECGMLFPAAAMFSNVSTLDGVWFTPMIRHQEFHDRLREAIEHPLIAVPETHSVSGD